MDSVHLELQNYINHACEQALVNCFQHMVCIHVVYVIESAVYGVLFTSCLCQKPERARYERVRAFDTNDK